MGVYVKDMEMPMKCLECPYSEQDEWITDDGTREFREFGDWMCAAQHFKTICDDEEIETMMRPEWCPLVEVKTPHDRLIDAGIYKKLLADDSKLWVLGHTPAVIEAEVE